MKLHEKINRYLADHGIKQTFVAEQIGMSVKTLNSILRGRQRLNADVYERICRDGLKIDPGYFFEDNVLDNKTNAV